MLKDYFIYEVENIQLVSSVRPTKTLREAWRGHL